LAHFLASDEKYRDLISTMIIDRIWWPKAHPRPARAEENRSCVGARRALGRFDGYLKRMVEAIAPVRSCGGWSANWSFAASDEGQAARQLLPAGH
jgi:hypothetical protein